MNHIIKKKSLIVSINMKQMRLIYCLLISSICIFSQEKNKELLTLDKIYKSKQFKQESLSSIFWIDNGNAYVTIEDLKGDSNKNELIKHNIQTRSNETVISHNDLIFDGKQIYIEDFKFSNDNTKVIIFANTERVWRFNTKGDYFLMDLKTKKVTKIGSKFKKSSLQFAKLSSDNNFVVYVHNFNLYKENCATQEITQLTFDDGKNLINGTFDWAYEEEFGKRDGFMLNEKSDKVAFWNQDISKTGTFYMINNTDSIYSKPIPIQYPKVGEPPSKTKVGIVELKTNKITWIPIEGDPVNNYLPGMQWVSSNVVLIQQLNRKQNTLTIWSYNTENSQIKKVYTEKEDTWVDIYYPDMAGSSDSENNLVLVDNNQAFLRLTENGSWRNVLKVSINDGSIKKVTPFNFDIAALLGASKENIYFMASPDNSTQRYLYSTPLSGNGKYVKLTPKEFTGLNTYNISPNLNYALHSFQSTTKAKQVSLISVADHKEIYKLIENKTFQGNLEKLQLPKIEFIKLKTISNIEVDARVIYPIGFDKSKKYPVIFHVYGEPWGAVATDTQIGLWNTYMAQNGFIIVDADNRGTPCLKGSAWRKCIYNNVGIVNTKDQAEFAKEYIKLPFVDTSKVGVWGWSGGGSMTLNLIFQYPEIYKTGVAVAGVANQLTYDNIYQERYMGLPSESKQNFIDGSPITHAKKLNSKLLVIHGTGDDNVHYQNCEMLINELIKHNKQFDVFPYPNRSHGINEGENTSLHLYTMISNYFIKNIGK